MTFPIGAHTSSPNPLDDARALGADVLQCTLSDPQSWKGPTFDLPVPILIENTAGGKHAMARYLEALDALWTRLADAEQFDKVGFCLDTCHAFAAGLDLSTLVDDVRAVTGRIDLVHLNDSQRPAGSGGDRHATLGAGLIDPDELVGVVRAAGAPVVLETPGGVAEHAGDMEWLRARL